MSWLHIHLLVNHLPVIGTVVLLALLAYAVVREDPELIVVALGAFVLLAVAGVGVYLTGEPAEEAAERLPAFTEVLVERHEEAALVATVLLGAFGALALGALLLLRRRRTVISIRVARVALALAVIPTVAMGYAAWCGGQLAHAEIRVDEGSRPLRTEDDAGAEEAARSPAHSIVGWDQAGTSASVRSSVRLDTDEKTR